jgi:hypothetical protein
MKKVLLLLAIAFVIVSCKKDDDPESYKIRYVVSGEGIEEIKYNMNNVNYSVKKSFANGWDTTFTHTSKQKLQLQAKAKNSNNVNLTGVIYLNENEVAKQVDDSKDTENKYEVKIEYQIQ